MKKAVLVLTMILFFCTLTVSAQPAGKKWELGMSFSYTNYKWSGDTESEYVLNLPIRAGYYVWKGLEIEPEFMLTKFKDGDTAYILSANLAYNFKTSGSLRPFVLAGFGFGNGIPVAHLVEGESDINATVINFGAGVKYLIGSTAALRFEYRYTHDHLKYQGGYSENMNIHQVLAGISVFF
jgi:opacity protein-like surface antigen